MALLSIYNALTGAESATLNVSGSSTIGAGAIGGDNLLLNGVGSDSTTIVPITGSTTITAAAHGNRLCVLNSNTDMTITLAAMTGTGASYKFAVGTAFSSKTCKIVATGAHLFGGVAMNTDTAAGTLFTVNVATSAAGSTNITLDGATTGGRKGDWVEIVDGASSIGFVSGMLNGSGTEATPFS